MPDRKRATELLCAELCSGPIHCFGVHSECSTDYRQVSKAPEPAQMKVMTAQKPHLKSQMETLQNRSVVNPLEKSVFQLSD